MFSFTGIHSHTDVYYNPSLVGLYGESPIGEFSASNQMAVTKYKS
jgi:hypothetical protein